MDWLEYGYWGLFLAALLSGTVVPFSSELVLIAGLAYGMDPWTSLIVATIGNSIGGYTTFWIGHLGNLEWIEKYFRVKHEKLLEWERTVEKYGAYFAIFGWLPLLGNVIMLALGFFRAKPIASAWWMTLGKTARYAGIIWIMN